MSFDEYHSYTQELIRQRSEVGYVPLSATGAKKDWCPICKKVLKPFKPGILICPGCGQQHDIRRLKQEKKLRSKFASSVTNQPTIISQKKRSYRVGKTTDSINENLTEEDKADLRAAGLLV